MRQDIGRWLVDRGDYTHNLNYDLNEDSIVWDLGGHIGTWATQIIEKFNPNMFIAEPIDEFYNILVENFTTNEKVRLLNCGVKDSNTSGVLYLSDDGSSSCLVGGETVDIKYHTLDYLMGKYDVTHIDLLQINIEGDEYDLLDYMLKEKIVDKVSNLQIQFHLGVKDDVSRRESIRDGLQSAGFTNKFNYPFVWEGWTKSK